MALRPTGGTGWVKAPDAPSHDDTLSGMRFGGLVLWGFRCALTRFCLFH